MLYFIIFSLKVIGDFWDVPRTLFISMGLLVFWDISIQTLPKRRLLKTSGFQRKAANLHEITVISYLLPWLFLSLYCHVFL